MKIIDAHIHLWDIDRLDYPWLANVPAINRTYLLSDYDEARGDTAVEAVVFVQCECRPDQYRDELAWVQSLADRDPRLKAIVPWAPLAAGASKDGRQHSNRIRGQLRAATGLTAAPSMSAMAERELLIWFKRAPLRSAGRPMTLRQKNAGTW